MAMPLVEVDGKKYSPAEISAMILTQDEDRPPRSIWAKKSPKR